MVERGVRIFTFGYEGWGNRVPELDRKYSRFNKLIRGRDVKWIDVRWKRQGRAKGFVGRTPERLFRRGHYSWIGEFGNMKPGTGLQIKDFSEGFVKLLREVDLARKKYYDLVLFCHCENYSGCHRSTLVPKIRAAFKKRGIRNVMVHQDFPGLEP